MDSGTPYLSIVATARNDNHGGDLIRRMQVFVDGVLEQCRRHELPAELILVEWNPPADRPRLAEALRWPINHFCTVRIIEVPHELHRRFKHSDRLPLYQMIAKNVGIRRAHGEFVLATNVDIILSNELLRFLASRQLRDNLLYRVNRIDVRENVPDGGSMDEVMDFCRNNVIRYNHKSATLEFRHGVRQRRFPSLEAYRRVNQVQLFCFRLLAISYYACQGGRYRQRIINHWNAFKRETGFARQWAGLHINACGDFTLLARKLWVKMKGYPELEMFSMHIDSLLCFGAFYSGISQACLPHPIYHIEHRGGWSPQVERDRSLDARLETKQIERVTDEQLAEWGRQMERERRPVPFNNENWGMADAVLPERVMEANTAAP